MCFVILNKQLEIQVRNDCQPRKNKKLFSKNVLTSLVKFDILNRQLEKKIARSLKTEQNVKTFEVRK